MNNLTGEYQHGVSGKTLAYTTHEYRGIQAELKKYSFHADSPTNDPIYLYIEPDETIRVKILPASDSALNYTLYKNADATGGTEILNENANIAASKDPTLATITENPTVNDVGTDIVDLQLSGTSDGPGASDVGQPSDISPDVLGWIIDEDTPLLVELTPENSEYVSCAFNVERHVQKTE